MMLNFIKLYLNENFKYIDYNKYYANEVMNGRTEVLAYRMAVVVEKFD